jgi:hypothetical protein
MTQKHQPYRAGMRSRGSGKAGLLSFYLSFTSSGETAKWKKRMITVVKHTLFELE